MAEINSIIAKWNGKEYVINDLHNDTTIKELRARIYEETGVRPDRQKILNLKCKDDDSTIDQLKMKPGFKLMVIGSTEEDIIAVNKAPENQNEVINDFTVEQEEDIEVENMEVHLAKIQKRIKDYKIQELNPFRECKKLVVLDIDYTLFDHRSVASNGHELMRPYLHEFLTRVYKYYDIVIWSATSMKWINEKMKLLGVTDNPNYKIAFHLDYLAMISVYTAKHGVIDVKPLGVIWGKYPAYSARNTIMFDDIRRNFIMNPRSGLKIKAFKQAHLNRDKDTELLKLAEYLELIADVEDFQTLNHRKWQEYKKKSQKLHARERSNQNT